MYADPPLYIMLPNNYRPLVKFRKATKLAFRVKTFFSEIYNFFFKYIYNFESHKFTTFNLLNLLDKIFVNLRDFFP